MIPDGFLLLVKAGIALAALIFGSYQGYLLIENFHSTKKLRWLAKHAAAFTTFVAIEFGLALLNSEPLVSDLIFLKVIVVIGYPLSFLFIPVGWLMVARYKYGLLGVSERVFGFGVEDLRRLPRKPGEKIFPWPW